MSDKQLSRPWWREPWPWILMAGPAVAVAGCIVTIVLAVRNFGDQAIADGGTRRGLVVEKPGMHAPGAAASDAAGAGGTAAPAASASREDRP